MSTTLFISNEKQDSAENRVYFTKFNDNSGKSAKSYDLIDDKVTKIDPEEYFFNGSFKTMSVKLSELPNFIKSLKTGEILTQGIRAELDSGCCPSDTRRTKDAFGFSEKAGILLIDSDSLDKFSGINSLDDLHDALNKLDPILESTWKFTTTSASSYISYKEHNTSLKGAHTYIAI